MVLTKERTVGEIAAGRPSAVRVFERYQIDYCCGGRRSVEQACQEKGVSAEQVLADVENTSSVETATDWTSAPLADLIDYILRKHHAYLRAELPALEYRLAKVLEAHGANHGSSLVPLEHTLQDLKAELGAHMMKEEVILFPLIKQMEAAEKTGAPFRGSHCGSVNNPIRVMEHEHDDAATALREIRRVTSGYTPPPEACNTYRALLQGLQGLEADLHAHIHLENNILFRRASSLESRLV